VPERHISAPSPAERKQPFRTAQSLLMMRFSVLRMNPGFRDFMGAAVTENKETGAMGFLFSLG
ncbi:hypothetical protein XENORESO_015143, partial [Xenotaenia resolanae]